MKKETLNTKRQMFKDDFTIKRQCEQTGYKKDLVTTRKTKKAEFMVIAYCLRSLSPWYKWVLMAPAQAVQGRPGPSGAGPVPSEWILYGSWGGAEGEGEALKPEQCHVSEGPDSATPDQQRWYMDPNNSDCRA